MIFTSEIGVISIMFGELIQLNLFEIKVFLHFVDCQKGCQC